MSILIKDMEMPTNCEKCPFLDYEEGFCFASGVKGKSGWYEFTLCPGGIKGGRHEDCPLIELPPHGRLRDFDIFNEQAIILMDEFYKNGEYAEERGANMLRHIAFEIPTIIEAEEGE